MMIIITIHIVHLLFMLLIYFMNPIFLILFNLIGLIKSDIFSVNVHIFLIRYEKFHFFLVIIFLKNFRSIFFEHNLKNNIILLNVVLMKLKQKMNVLLLNIVQHQKNFFYIKIFLKHLKQRIH